MTRMVICQDDARNTTGCGNGHLQDVDGEAIRSDCQARMATGHPNGMGRGNSKGKDRVKDCREHGSSGTGRDDLRGRQTPSPFLYMYSSESAHPRRALTPCPGALNRLTLRHKKPPAHLVDDPGHQDRNQHPLPRAEKQSTSTPQSDTRDSAANLGINCFIQNTKKLKQPSLMLLNTRYEALAAKFECVDTFEF